MHSVVIKHYGKIAKFIQQHNSIEMLQFYDEAMN